MRLFLLIFIVILVFIEMAFGWKAIIDRYDLKYINEKRLKVIDSKLFRFNRTTKAVSIEVEIFYDLPSELMIEIKIFGFMSNEYRQLPLVISRKVCDIILMEYQWLNHDLNCNFPDSCPIPKGRYYIKDYLVDVSRFPKRPWSFDNYKIESRVYYKNEEEGLLDIYVITTDNDEYEV